MWAHVRHKYWPTFARQTPPTQHISKVRKGKVIFAVGRVEPGASLRHLFKKQCQRRKKEKKKREKEKSRIKCFAGNKLELSRVLLFKRPFTLTLLHVKFNYSTFLQRGYSERHRLWDSGSNIWGLYFKNTLFNIPTRIPRHKQRLLLCHCRSVLALLFHVLSRGKLPCTHDLYTSVWWKHNSTQGCHEISEWNLTVQSKQNMQEKSRSAALLIGRPRLPGWKFQSSRW